MTDATGHLAGFTTDAQGEIFGIPIYVSDRAPLGSPISLSEPVLGMTAAIVMHKLDLNSIRYPNPYDRLRALREWVARELERRIRP